MASAKYSVIFADRASQMMVSHSGFLARVNPAAARRLLSEFRSATDRIAAQPLAYPYADDIDACGIPPATYRKCLIAGRYKALFTVENQTVYIDAVIDCRQENSALY
ncbi:MAG: type II toxin-antitoxin system RelE/ParE family toxin [Clostridiales Family XIII bacterium]|jgi:plasmid stabilization system protein ParE|nr:type II toxin-antitoxin system RelE/ParE family toxin [Clostridiales Family XIII bacterium]